jgi:hypothetical protein
MEGIYYSMLPTVSQECCKVQNQSSSTFSTVENSMKGYIYNEKRSLIVYCIKQYKREGVINKRDLWLY